MLVEKNLGRPYYVVLKFLHREYIVKNGAFSVPFAPLFM